MAGNLEFRYGAMNSGKSTDVIQMAYNYRENNKVAIVMKPSIDTKGKQSIVSRIGAKVNVDILLGHNDTPTRLLLEYLDQKNLESIDAIIIDEAQFLSPAQIDDFWQLTANTGVHVIAFGLRADFQTVGFPGSTRLLELADKIQEIATICRCGKKARCNTRKVNGKFVFEGSQVAIDGEGETSYESLCKTCYHNERDKHKLRKNYVISDQKTRYTWM